MQRLFQEAPEEVVRFIRSKRLRPSFAWQDVAPEEHAYAFTVAKSTGHAVLEDIFSAVSDAVVKGQSFETFRAGLEPLLREKGWWGRGLSFDDIRQQWNTGQLGSVRRLRTIYWSNIQSARAAGEWQRIQRAKRFLPFLVYLRSSAERRRPEHLAWATKPVVLPVDHSWWLTHYPPNGWLCKCLVRQVQRTTAEALGYTSDTEAPALDLQPWTNRRTGRTEFHPAGIDPGWASNVGVNRERNVANFLGDRLQQRPAIARPAAITDILSSPLFKQVIEERGKARINVPIAPVQDAIRERSGTAATHVFLSSDSARHILDDYVERGLSIEDFSKASEVLAAGEIQSQKEDPQSFVLLGTVEGRRWRAALKVLEEEVFLTSFHTKGRAR